MKIIFLLALLATMCTAFGQGQTPHSESFDVVKYVEDYIKKNMKPIPQGEFETKSEWEERVRNDEQRQELMHEALYKLYGSPFEKKVNLRLGQYDIEHECFPMETNGLGDYALPSSKDDGPKWRALWNNSEFSIRKSYKYGLVNGKPRLVFLAAVKPVSYYEGQQQIYPIDEETGKSTEFVWRNGAWQLAKKGEKYGDQIFMLADVELGPSFNGDLHKFLRSNIKYSIAQEYDILGPVFVSFIVEKDGYITNVYVSRSVAPALDKEAVRVVKSMPKWNPGKIDGIPVRVSAFVIVNFTSH